MENHLKVLPPEFFQQEDTLKIARALLGKILYTNFNNDLTAGVITETEAYLGAQDRACHAYNNRRTKRTEPMFANGGIAYVYLCYGMHHLFNIVTHQKETPHAVLIRAIQPLHGLEIMQARRKNRSPLSSGPGTVSQALGITTQHTGMPLLTKIFIEDQPAIPTSQITATPRIGVEYAGKDALLPYRFLTTLI